MDCNGCTVCCDILPVPVLNKEAYEKCVHCKLNKCIIHDDKPEFCSSYNCMYVQVEGIPVKLRPDKCGVVFEKISDKIIFGIEHPDISLKKEAVRQTEKFVRQGFSVAIKKKNARMKVFLANGHKAKDIEDLITSNTREDGIIWN